MAAELLDRTFSALADPTRRSVLAHLAERGEATVNELAEPFAMTLPAFSKHLKVLERAGLIVRSRHAQFRPCAINPAPLAQASEWLEGYRALWEGRLDRLEAYLGELQALAKTERDNGDA